MSEHTQGRLTPNIVGHFDSYQQWVNKGASWLASPQYRGAMCIDAKGRRVAMGADFMRARDENTFPVYFFWDCEPKEGECIKEESSELAAANARIAKLESLVAERDAMLGKRPCQNSRCNVLNEAQADLETARKRDEEWHEHTACKTLELSDVVAEREAARALLREVLEAVDSRAKEYKDRGLGVAEVPEIARVRSYLDVCDTLEGK